MKKALELMKQAIAMMESGCEGSSEGQEPKEDGTNSSIGNSETGGEANNINDSKQKKSMIVAAMKRKQF